MITAVVAEIADTASNSAAPHRLRPIAQVPDRNRHGGAVTMFQPICAQLRRCQKENLEPVIELAVEIAREGREGRRIGTLFTFGDAKAVLARSRALILDPLAGHTENTRNVRDANLRGTIKELAQLD